MIDYFVEIDQMVERAILTRCAYFNTSGPVVLADHYCIPPLTRVDLDDVCQLVRNKRYFVLHAPRQTGARLMERPERARSEQRAPTAIPCPRRSSTGDAFYPPTALISNAAAISARV